MRVDLTVSAPLFFPQEVPQGLLVEVLNPSPITVLEGKGEIQLHAGTQPGVGLLEIAASESLALTFRAENNHQELKFRLNLIRGEGVTNPEDLIWILYVVFMPLSEAGPQGRDTHLATCGIHIPDYNPLAYQKVSSSGPSLWERLLEADP